MEEKFYLKFGHVIREIRRSKEISQEYMASKLHISQNVYSKIENGKCKCTMYRFLGIMELLSIDPADILSHFI